MTGESNRVNIELEFTARFIKGRHCAYFNGHTVFQSHFQELRLLPEDDAAGLRSFILEHEIAVSGGGAAEPGDFSADPCQAEMALDDQPRGANHQ